MVLKTPDFDLVLLVSFVSFEGTGANLSLLGGLGSLGGFGSLGRLRGLGGLGSLGGLGDGRGLGLGLGGSLGQQDGLDVGEDTTLDDGDVAQELVQLLVVAHGQLHVAGHDAVLLVVAGSVAGQLQDFGGQVLEDGREVDGGAATDAGRVATLAQKARDTADGELETRLGRAGNLEETEQQKRQSIVLVGLQGRMRLRGQE